MATTHSVDLNVGPGVFKGLASQNLLFHQCVCELIDNSIAAKKDGKPFSVLISLKKNKDDSNYVDLWLCDRGKGMSLEKFKKALQLGESATTDSRLNEHGFGMKHALATLTEAKLPWSVWSGLPNECLRVQSPFDSKMTIEESEWDDVPYPDEIKEEIKERGVFSTAICAKVKLSFVQTVQGRGAASSNLDTLKWWLYEHLGVTYRGYFIENKATGEKDGRIAVVVEGVSQVITSIDVPMATPERTSIEFSIQGSTYKMEYVRGALDVELASKAVMGISKTKAYYLGNQKTQGIDIRLGKRVIATKVLGVVWKTKDADGSLQPLEPHNRFNHFCGELILPEMPRGVLRTKNDKTDFNLDDSDWEIIFNKLRTEEFTPKEDKNEWKEGQYRDAYLEVLESAKSEGDIISKETLVWKTGVRIDLGAKYAVDSKFRIFEFKAKQAAPLDLYQLKMYWDGLELQGEVVKDACLVAESFTTNIDYMIEELNKMKTPKGNSYVFTKATLAEKGLKRHLKESNPKKGKK